MPTLVGSGVPGSRGYTASNREAFRQLRGNVIVLRKRECGMIFRVLRCSDNIKLVMCVVGKHPVLGRVPVISSTASFLVLQIESPCSWKCLGRYSWPFVNFSRWDASDCHISDVGHLLARICVKIRDSKLQLPST